MICSKCGKRFPEDVMFCDNCGVRVEEERKTPEVVNNYYPQTKQPVTVMGWIGRSLITLIPFIGPLIYLIMLFVWASDSAKEESSANWAKAQLWMMLISIGIVVVIFLVVFVITLCGVNIINSGMNSRMGSGMYY